MITLEQVYYIRYILLLLQAGTDLLRAITEKALQKKNETLQQFLDSNRHAILQTNLAQTQKDTLFPTTAQGAFIDDFDITLLSHLILKYLNRYIEKCEEKAVNDIRDLRNKYHAHAKEAKMNATTYKGEWNQLETIINYVGTGMSPAVQKKHKDMIHSIKNDPLDFTSAIDQIKKMDQSAVFFENIQKSLAVLTTGQEQLTETLNNVQTSVSSIVAAVASGNKDTEELKRLILEVIATQNQQGKEIKIILKLLGRARVSPGDQATQESVVDSLAEACRRYNENSMPSNAVEEEMYRLCEEVENANVKIEKISSGSIIFEFKCFSLNAILELLDYVYSSRFQKRLNQVAKGFQDYKGNAICITAEGIDIQSIQNVIKYLQRNRNDISTVLQFEMSCSGVDGLLHALEVFEEGKAVNSLNALSKALSEKIEKPVTLHTSIDKDQMTEAIQSIQQELDRELQQTVTEEHESNKKTSEITSEDTSNLKEISTNSSHNKTFFRRAWSWTRNKIVEYYYSSEARQTTKQQNQDAWEHSTKRSETLDSDNFQSCEVEPKAHIENDCEKTLSVEDVSENPDWSFSKKRNENAVKLTFNNDLVIKDNDYCSCAISSCAVLSPDKLLLADNVNEKLKVLNVHTGDVTDEKTLKSYPKGIAVLPQDQAVVTLPSANNIIILSTTKNMKTIRNIMVRSPWHIAYNQDKLFVVSCGAVPSIESSCVLVLNLQGDQLGRIILDIPGTQIYLSVIYIAISKDHQSMYISNPVQDTLCKYTLKGERTAVYANVQTLQGLVVLEDGSLLVCCQYPGTLYHISADLKHESKLTNDVPWAQSICYQPEKRNVYVFCDYNSIKVFRLHHKPKLSSKLSDAFEWRKDLSKLEKLEKC